MLSIENCNYFKLKSTMTKKYEARLTHPPPVQLYAIEKFNEKSYKLTVYRNIPVYLREN